MGSGILEAPHSTARGCFDAYVLDNEVQPRFDPAMKITSLLSALLLCLFASGCANKPRYNSVSVPLPQSTVVAAVNSDAQLATTVKEVRRGVVGNGEIRNATQVPPFIADKATDDAIAVSTTAATGAIAVVTPTVRDVPAIAVNKATDLAHDGGLGAARAAHQIATPTLRATERAVVKLGNAFVIRPMAAVDRQVRRITRYSIDSYQGPILFQSVPGTK
jgi:hypothetical protein